MPKTRPRVKSAETIRRELKVTERELRRITELQWVYAKRMLKFGFASWIFGLSCFFLLIVVLDSNLLAESPVAWPLLILAAAAPILITAVAAHRFSSKIKRLERIRTLLLVEYEKAILKRVSNLIKK